MQKDFYVTYNYNSLNPGLNVGKEKLPVRENHGKVSDNYGPDIYRKDIYRKDIYPSISYDYTEPPLCFKVLTKKARSNINLYNIRECIQVLFDSMNERSKFTEHVILPCGLTAGEASYFYYYLDLHEKLNSMYLFCHYVNDALKKLFNIPRQDWDRISKFLSSRDFTKPYDKHIGNKIGIFFNVITTGEEKFLSRLQTSASRKRFFKAIQIHFK